MTYSILIIEDDAAFGIMLQSWFERNGYQVVFCTKVERAKAVLTEKKIDLILSDLRLPDGDGIMLLAWLRSQKINTPVVIMTSYAEVQSAVSAIKLGASDFLEKPINPTVLKEKVEQILKSSQEISADRETIPVKIVTKQTQFIAGTSPAAQQMQEHICLVAPTQMSVLLFGESGTGKEYAARAIHDNSLRKNAPFMAIDCGALSKDLAPSELFGHLKGSFTSAIADKKGVFEEAKGGTVFLDEIGNLPYEVQVQLLRALQEQKVRPVGASNDIKVDIRIISATNEKIESAIQRGSFREDLYHRLNEFSIYLPPLRERGEDIELFANYFLEGANKELGKNIKTFDKDTIEVFMKYAWSGNLRELRNVVRRAVLFAQGNEIQPGHLPILTNISEKTVFISRSQNEKAQIEAALEKAKGNKTLAARLLEIDRKTLYNKINQYNL